MRTDGRTADGRPEVQADGRKDGRTNEKTGGQAEGGQTTATTKCISFCFVVFFMGFCDVNICFIAF